MKGEKRKREEPLGYISRATFAVDWALKANYLSIYLSVCPGAESDICGPVESGA